MQDPDTANLEDPHLSKSEWEFIWLCYRNGEPPPLLETALDVDVPTGPMDITVLSDKGGCFGTGPGRLKIPKDTGTTLNPFKVSVVSGDYTCCDYSMTYLIC